MTLKPFSSRATIIPKGSSMSLGTVLAVALLLAVAASAQELVTNGSFETGDFAGWTQFGDTGYSDVVAGGSYAGMYYGRFGPLTPGGIQQTLAASAGSALNVSFWYYAGGASAGDFMSVDIGGNTFFNVSTGASDWTQYTISITALLDNPILTLTFQNNPSYWFVDDIRVTRGPPALGACCFSDGHCEDLLEAACLAPAIWHADTNCSSYDCLGQSPGFWRISVAGTPPAVGGEGSLAFWPDGLPAICYSDTGGAVVR